MNSLNYVFKHLLNLTGQPLFHLDPLVLQLFRATDHGHWTGFSRALAWIFIHDTEKVVGGLMLLFFSLVISIGPPGNFSANTLAADH